MTTEILDRFKGNVASIREAFSLFEFQEFLYYMRKNAGNDKNTCKRTVNAIGRSLQKEQAIFELASRPDEQLLGGYIRNFGQTGLNLVNAALLEMVETPRG